ncbi:MAG TPA: AI-2E family transporter [Thermoanaerobaculia bacterium]|nr:AI-2E family transporter [Thermoanaerobaculia bacterium]
MERSVLDERTAPRSEPGQTRARLLAVTATVLVLAFLKWSKAVTMPLAFAIFLIALAWPLQERLAKRLPRWASFTLTLLTLLLVFGLFVGALVWSGQAVADRAPQYATKVQEIYGQLEARARGLGMPLPEGGISGMAGGGGAKAVLAAVSSSISLILLVAAMTALGLFEVHDFKTKARRAFRDPHHGEALVESMRSIVGKYGTYLWARTVTAIIQAVTVWGFALLMGLDFAFVWGVLAFLLNYIPTLGSAVAVIPPSLFALVQFDGYSRPLLVFLGMAGLQILCGNYIDPLIQGKYLSLSPLVVLFSIVFWGWIWGIAGAFLSVPVMIGLVIATDHFPNTRWIARLLAEAPKEG